MNLSLVKPAQAQPAETAAERIARMKAEMEQIAAAEEAELIADMAALQARLQAASKMQGVRPLAASEFAIVGNRLGVSIKAMSEGRR